jgi:hypothetical protein
MSLLRRPAFWQTCLVGFAGQSHAETFHVLSREPSKLGRLESRSYFSGRWQSTERFRKSANSIIVHRRRLVRFDTVLSPTRATPRATAKSDNKFDRLQKTRDTIALSGSGADGTSFLAKVGVEEAVFPRIVTHPLYSSFCLSQPEIAASTSRRQRRASPDRGDFVTGRYLAGRVRPDGVDTRPHRPSRLAKFSTDRLCIPLGWLSRTLLSQQIAAIRKAPPPRDGCDRRFKPNTCTCISRVWFGVGRQGGYNAVKSLATDS